MELNDHRMACILRLLSGLSGHDSQFVAIICLSHDRLFHCSLVFHHHPFTATELANGKQAVAVMWGCISVVFCTMHIILSQLLLSLVREQTQILATGSSADAWTLKINPRVLCALLGTVQQMKKSKKSRHSLESLMLPHRCVG